MKDILRRDKLGRRINPRSVKAHQRNALLGRFAYISSALNQLRAEILREMKECPEVVRHADAYLSSSAESAQRELAIMKQITDEFFIDAYNIRTPPPPAIKETDK